MFAQLLGFSFAFDLASAFRSPEGFCYSLRGDSVKVAADYGLWLILDGEREGYGLWGESAVAEASVMLQQHEVAMCSTGEAVLGSRDPGGGGLHRLPGGVVWIVTCACTQASWWLQKLP